jgi:NADH-quinone oxidoreductase subunit C
MTEALERLQAACAAAESGMSADGIAYLRVGVEQVAEVAMALRDRYGYGRFIDLTAVEYPERDDRIDLQYLFYSLIEHPGLRVKARTSAHAPSITPIFAGANWYEREVYDLFGVHFAGHPDLTRIMLPDDWQGYPLRRDEPIGGEPVDFTVTREIYGT